VLRTPVLQDQLADGIITQFADRFGAYFPSPVTRLLVWIVATAAFAAG
jgi:hypothetical protein